MDLYTALTTPEERAKLRVRGVYFLHASPVTEQAIREGYYNAPFASLDDLVVSYDPAIGLAAATCSVTLTPDVDLGFIQSFEAITVWHPDNILAYRFIENGLDFHGPNDQFTLALKLSAFATT